MTLSTPKPASVQKSTVFNACQQPEELPDRYAMLRGLSYADRIPQPVLLIQGTLDMITPMDHALWMERALRDAGNQQVQVELIDRMGHFCELTGQGYKFDRVAGLVIQWFSQTLQ